MRRIFGINDEDGQAGGGQPPPEPTAELTDAKAELATVQKQLADEKKWADAARGYDAKLAAMQQQRPDDFAMVSDLMAGREATPADVTTSEELDEPTRSALGELQTQVRQLTAKNEALTHQMDSLNGARIEDNVSSQITQARTEMGDAVVDALLPGIEQQVRANEGLTRIPGGVLTLLRAADHSQVADRLKQQQEAEETERQAKLARTRGLPARGLGVETTPGTERQPLSALEALNLAIRTEDERLATHR